MIKLNNYLTLASVVLTNSTINAAIIYTDVNPDVVLDNGGDFYNINMDSNIGNEFRVNFQEQGGWGGKRSAYISGLNGNQVGAYFDYSNYQYNLNVYSSYSIISSLNSWQNEALFGTFNFGGGGYGGNSNGAWSSKFDKYVALKFNDGVNTYYGWARFDVTSGYNSITIKDFAFENQPNTHIKAGDMTNINLIANNIIANDISNKHNGNDLEVSFNKAADENGILNYRMIAVKTSASSNFNISKANSSTSYVSLTPNGGNHTSIFNSSSKDSDGELIKENIPYSIFVLSVPDLTNLTSSNLSEPSNSITLQSGVGINESLFNNVTLNISNKIITISSKSIIESLSITDLSGKSIFKSKNIINSTINLNNHKSGIYLLTIESNNKIETKKIKL